MAYQNPNGVSPYKVKALAYVMAVEFGHPQYKVAEFFGVSAGTISLWIKEARYMIQIGQLQRELAEARNELPPPGGFGGLTFLG
ncbi:hypothetical protein AB6G22_20650 [Providencia hangzhouensis]|uniref:hypothetical protein n=1 Tax=Providencia hangzhouensis TaxID=3031799 RepID=UPI0034DD0D78